MYRTTRQRRPRRTRYIARVSHRLSNEVKDIHIMAYDALTAGKLAERAGYTVLEGPTTAAEAAKRAARKRNWQPDRAAIATAFEAMTGMALPRGLRIGVETATTRQGQFKVATDGSLSLTVGGDNDRQRADEVLWHELCHLKQYMERIARHADLLPGTREAFRVHSAACKSERASRVGYLNRPSEREARTWEALAPTDTLTKEA